MNMTNLNQASRYKWILIEAVVSLPLSRKLPLSNSQTMVNMLVYKMEKYIIKYKKI